MSIYEVSVPISSTHRRGREASGSLGLSEKLELDKGFVLDVKDEADGSKFVGAVILVEAETREVARDFAMERVRGYFSLIGLETRIGTMVEDSKVTVREIRPPEVKSEPGVTHIKVYDSISLKDSAHVELVPSPDRLRAIYDQYVHLIASEKAVLLPLVELYNLAWHEQFERSRFLTLVSAVESLLPPAEAIPEITELVKGFESSLPRKRFALKRRAPPAQDDSTERRIAQLRSRLGELKKESISDRFRRLVKSLEVPFESGEKVADEIYALRGKLVHDYLNADVRGISERTEEAFTIVEAGLKRALGLEGRH